MTASARAPSVGTARARTISAVRGEVLEIGPGRGRNLPLYASSVQLTACEPSRRRRRALARRRAACRVEVVDAVAEALPFPDASFDAVVATFVLCSVDDQRRALSEITRVLRHGGHFVTAEHVAWPPDSRGRGLQVVWHRVVRAFGGCSQLSRADQLIEAEPALDVHLDHYEVWAPVRTPVVVGTAVRR